MEINDNYKINDLKINNYVINIHELIEHKVKLLSKPISIQVLLSNKCNLKCKMCNFEEYHDNTFMNKDIIEQIIKNNPQLATIEWSGGGEPLLHPNIEYFIDLANIYRINQIIITNALLLTNKLIEKICRYNINLILSIDGGSKEVYENVRINGNFDKLKENLKVLKEFRKKFYFKGFIRIYCVVIRDNYKYLKQMIDFCIEFNIKEILFITDSTNNIENNVIKYGSELERHELQVGLKDLMSYANQNRIDCMLDEKLQHILHLGEQQQTIDVKDSCYLCLAPWQQLRILPKGDVFPSYFCEKPVGNVNEVPLYNIWNSEIMIQYRENILKNNYKNICNKNCSCKNNIVRTYTAMERFLHTLII